MNTKTARLINKCAKVCNLPPKKLKRQYNKTPRNKRFDLKAELKNKIMELE